MGSPPPYDSKMVATLADGNNELLVTLETTQRATNLTLSADGLHVVSIDTGTEQHCQTHARRADVLRDAQDLGLGRLCFSVKV